MKKYICPICKNELILISEPQYHNEYILYFECYKCNFRTNDVVSYKDMDESIEQLVNHFNIIVEEKHDKNKLLQTEKLPENKLKKIFDIQYNLNKRIIPDYDLLIDSCETEWVKNFTLALQQEIAEFIDCFNWKWWSKKEIDKNNAKIELIDMLHFWVSLCQLVGMDADEVFELYTKKAKLNHERQDKGYKFNVNVKYVDDKEDNELLFEDDK